MARQSASGRGGTSEYRGHRDFQRHVPVSVVRVAKFQGQIESLMRHRAGRCICAQAAHATLAGVAALATAMLVLSLTAVAERLGPRGLLNPFPSWQGSFGLHGAASLDTGNDVSQTVPNERLGRTLTAYRLSQ